MKVLITGVTGLVGQKVAALLIESGHEVVGLTRSKEKAQDKMGLPIEFYEWDTKGLPPQEAFTGVESVINLLGENIADKRWSDVQKKVIYQSRVETTKNLITVIDSLPHKIQSLVSGSAIGYYVSDRGDEEIDENEKNATDFLGSLCKDWEKSAQAAQNVARISIVRTGVVLSENGGALSKLLPLFKLGLGGPIGFGRQWMSWIHIDDIAQIFIEAALNPKYEGIFNGTAPKPVRNSEFTRALGKTLKRPALFMAPPFALKLAMGEMSQIVLDSQKVIPKKLQSLGFNFKFTNIEKAFEEICHVGIFGHIKKKVRCSKFVTYQWVPRKKDEVFDFFGDAKNLEKITPKILNFKITYQSTPKIQEGTIFRYKLKVHGLPIKWETHIENWKDGEMFSDYQTKGPYKIWHHTHSFKDYKDGTLMKDEVFYKLPMGCLGEIFGGRFVRNDVNNIFSHRKEAISNLYKS